jgi:hypothetical protein
MVRSISKQNSVGGVSVGAASGLIWATLGPDDDPYGYPWFGLGLLSDYGLPLDCLHMFLAAKYCSLASTEGTLKVLLADSHALSTGKVAEDTVQKRADRREQEVQHISSLLGLHCQVIRASCLDQDPAFSEMLAEVRDCAAITANTDEQSLAEYSVRGIADVLHFHQTGGLKVGWSYDHQLTGRGRHHEYETDAIAAQIMPGVRAVYVRHGVTLDPRRPVAVPYTEAKDTSARLMLTGSDRGNFKAKLWSEAVKDRHRRPVIDHIAGAVAAFEALVMPLVGDNVFDKAEAIVHLLDCE